MGKTRDLFKKIRDTKGTFHAKMGIIKDRNIMDLTEAEDIKKGWQEYTEELYKKDLHDPDNHDGVITHLEPDIQEYEVKWALGSITMNKASGGDGIPVQIRSDQISRSVVSATLCDPMNRSTPGLRFFHNTLRKIQMNSFGQPNIYKHVPLNCVKLETLP